MKKREIKKYFFSVEGNTEKLYLEWLAKQINSKNNSNYNVSFNIRIEKSPIRRVKQISTLDKIDILHVIDYEETNNDLKFQDTLSHMKEAQQLKKINYCLGYSNYTFDLWIILHKIPLLASVNHRRNYLKSINKYFDSNFESMNDFKEEKNFTKILEQLSLSNVVDAIKHAEKIETNNIASGYTKTNYKGYSYFKNNPSLNIHEYIKKILQETRLYDKIQ